MQQTVENQSYIDMVSKKKYYLSRHLLHQSYRRPISWLHSNISCTSLRTVLCSHTISCAFLKIHLESCNVKKLFNKKQKNSRIVYFWYKSNKSGILFPLSGSTVVSMQRSQGLVFQNSASPILIYFQSSSAYANVSPTTKFGLQLRTSVFWLSADNFSLKSVNEASLIK